MGGKGGGGDNEMFQPQTSAQMMPEPTPAQQQAQAQLGTPYQPPTAQELQDAQNKRMLQGRGGPRAQVDPSMDPNAIAGAGTGSDATLGDTAAESVAPTRGRPRRKGAAPSPPDTGSV